MRVGELTPIRMRKILVVRLQTNLNLTIKYRLNLRLSDVMLGIGSEQLSGIIPEQTVEVDKMSRHIRDTRTRKS